jgi:transcriptional regulator with XRE-family HTH domain
MLSSSTLIRQARRAAGLTQTELAGRMGTTQSVIARLESPRSNPRLDTLNRALAAAGQQLEPILRPRSDVDETMIAANLRREPLERLRAFAAAYRNVSQLARTARRVTT